MKHAIVRGETTRQRHRDLVGETVSILCTCGQRSRSKAGSEGAFRAYEKHLRRAGVPRG